MPERLAHRLDEKTVPVNTPESPVGLLGRQTVNEDHAVPDLTSDTHASRSGSVDDDALLAEGRLGDANGGHQSREGDSTGTLDVVTRKRRIRRSVQLRASRVIHEVDSLEAGDVVSVLVQQALSVGESEVLEVDERVGLQQASSKENNSDPERDR